MINERPLSGGIVSQHQECECERQTCGERCEKCCPMYNQIPWKPGTAAKGFHCEKCNCNGHATSCRYDQDVADGRMSMDIRGKFRGGGVCINCTVSPNFSSDVLRDLSWNFFGEGFISFRRK